MIGAALGSVWDPPKAVTGVLLAFASGALISALAFELFEEANRLGGGIRSGFGLIAGAGRPFTRSSSHTSPSQRDGRTRRCNDRPLLRAARTRALSEIQ